jgi:hypothetical protein
MQAMFDSATSLRDYLVKQGSYKPHVCGGVEHGEVFLSGIYREAGLDLPDTWEGYSVRWQRSSYKAGYSSYLKNKEIVHIPINP